MLTRTRHHLRLRPIVHLRPFLDFVNKTVAFASISTSTETRLISRMTSRRTRSGRLWALIVADLAVDHFVGRLYLQNERFLGTHVGVPFTRHMRLRGIDDIPASFLAWLNVWRFLRTQHPELRDRIGTCGFCGRFFYRYHAKNGLCSPVCRIGPGLVKTLPSAWKAKLRTRILATARRIRQFEASHDPKVGEFARRYYDWFFGPVVGKVERLDSLRGIKNRQAFLAAWRFLFPNEERTRDLRNRIGLCPVCGFLFYRYRTKQITCGRRTCQVKHYAETRRRQRRPRR